MQSVPRELNQSTKLIKRSVIEKEFIIIITENEVKFKVDLRLCLCALHVGRKNCTCCPNCMIVSGNFIWNLALFSLSYWCFFFLIVTLDNASFLAWCWAFALLRKALGSVHWPRHARVLNIGTIPSLTGSIVGREWNDWFAVVNIMWPSRLCC